MTEFVEQDLSGARFRRVQLTGARLQLVDLSGARLRDVSLDGAEIDGEIDGLCVNGVEIAPLIRDELRRRQPARALIGTGDPDDARQAWAFVEQLWAPTYARAEALPAGTVDASVDGEWSFAQTLRHLVFVTDAWLGARLVATQGYHPWGVPFSAVDEFCDSRADLGVDPSAAPSFDEVLELRLDRVVQVRSLLADATAQDLAGPCAGPPWGGDGLTLLDCLGVVVSEELEHHRFAVRDLDVLAAR